MRPSERADKKADCSRLVPGLALMLAGAGAATKSLAWGVALAGLGGFLLLGGMGRRRARPFERKTLSRMPLMPEAACRDVPLGVL
jgi:hypothetical protein